MKSNFLFSMTIFLLFVISIQVFADDRELFVDYEGTKGENSFVDVKKLENVDMHQRGSICVELTEGGKGTSRENVEFSCTKVGEVRKGEYILKEEFASSNVDLNTIESAKEMEEAAEKLAELDISGEKVLVTDKNGRLCFSDLSVGVYFLEATDTAKYEKVTPFLITIPTFDEKEGEMNYDITVIPKHEPEPDEITTDSPGKPKAPQTGLDSPVLKYFIGAALIAMFLVTFNRIFKK